MPDPPTTLAETGRCVLFKYFSLNSSKKLFVGLWGFFTCFSLTAYFLRENHCLRGLEVQQYLEQHPDCQHYGF